jgi:hypothetical protein
MWVNCGTVLAIFDFDADGFTPQALTLLEVSRATLKV